MIQEPPRTREELQAAMQEEYDKLAGVSVDSIQLKFNGALRAMSGMMIVAAACYRRLKEAGAEIYASDAHRNWFERLADCSLLPEVVQQFYGRPAIVKAVAALRIEQQAQIVSDEPLTVVRFDRGEKQIEAVPPSRLESRDIAQVFGPDGIRDEGQQVQWLRARVRPEVESKPEPLPYEIKGKAFYVNRPTRFTKKELREIVERME